MEARDIQGRLSDSTLCLLRLDLYSSKPQGNSVFHLLSKSADDSNNKIGLNQQAATASDSRD